MNIDGTIGSKYQLPITTRPYDFGTDAIERQRVSLGGSLIDADFEYGLQATKWQSYADFRKTPSFFEIPGTDVPITSVTATTVTLITVVTTITPTLTTTTTGATGSTTSITLLPGSFGAGATAITLGQTVIVSPITGLAVVTAVNSPTSITITYPTQTAPTVAAAAAMSFYSSVVPNVGSVVNVSGLANGVQDANRAEGFFMVTAVSATNPAAFQYNTKGGNVSGSTISTSYTVIRRGGIFNNGACKVQNISSLATTDTSVTVQMVAGQGHGLMPGTPIIVVGYSGTNVNGNYIVQSIPNNISFTYTTPTGTTGTPTGGSIYIQPYAYTIHRPFDGGVIVSPNIPTHGASIVRQSKKVFRYQSGKGLLWSSGTLFCPNNDIANLTYSAGVITVTSAIPHGAPQAGATIQIKGVVSSGYNGTYTIASIIGDTQLTVSNTSPITDATATLGDQPRFVVPSWHGSSVRAGCFDDQNGMFWEYDGQTLWVVRRSSTFQLAGTITIAANSNNLNGSGSRYLNQLKINDRVVIRGMTYQVTRVNTVNNLNINPPYRGASDITLGVTMCKVVETRIPQSQFNRDTIDGLGPSGYKVDLTKMQMIGLQYTWYGAGFIDFMIRGSDGNWVYVHRFRNNNVNDEAYMRTGNMPVRYEICNESVAAASLLAVAIPDASSVAPIVLSDPTTYWPTSGVVMIGGEFISYTGKSGNTLTGIGRAATLNYNIADTSYSFAGSTGGSRSAGGVSTVNLVSCTCGPSLTHWGSALLMDGSFDSDRGYFFNYQVNAAAAVTAGTTVNLFMLRLSPSVSNGVVGDIGTRDLLNRAQLLLQRLDVFGGSSSASAGSTGSMVVSGILNPSGLSVSSWNAINAAGNGSQPSFAQVATSFTGSYIAGSGERIFSTISNNGQNSIDLSNLKEVCNGVIGGNQMFPDGPDTLLVQLSVPTGFPALASYSVNLFWTEAQA